MENRLGNTQNEIFFMFFFFCNTERIRRFSTVESKGPARDRGGYQILYLFPTLASRQLENNDFDSKFQNKFIHTLFIRDACFSRKYIFSLFNGPGIC